MPSAVHLGENDGDSWISQQIFLNKERVKACKPTTGTGGNRSGHGQPLCQLTQPFLPADLPISASVRPMLDEVDNRLWYAR